MIDKYSKQYHAKNRLARATRLKRIHTIFTGPQKFWAADIERRVSAHEDQDHSIPESLWYR